MKSLISFVILFLPVFILAEYNGVHIYFEVLLKNGNKIDGYNYIAHGENSIEYKKHLENNPKLFLLNQNTFEPGEYSYYKHRLEYATQKRLNI